jgi:E3 ubiquitin-protein ligase RNF14
MVLTDEEYDRWERLLLQRTLESMQDVMYCPRCSIAIVLDGNDTHGYCMNCRFDFCMLCKELFHVVNINFFFC